MYHRLKTVDLMISAEVAVRRRSRLSMVATFLEYRRVKRDTPGAGNNGLCRQRGKRLHPYCS